MYVMIDLWAFLINARITEYDSNTKFVLNTSK